MATTPPNSGAPLGALGRSLPEPLLLVDAHGVILDANPAAVRLLGGLDAGARRSLTAFFANADIPDYLDRCLRSGQMVVGRFTRSAGGGRSEVGVEGRRFATSDGRTPSVLLRVREDVGLKRHFALLNDKIDQLTGEVGRRRRAESVVAVQRELLELVARGGSLVDTLDLLIRSVEAKADRDILVSILLMDDDGRHLLDCAGPSLPEAYRQAIDGIEIGPEVGSCGAAAYENQPVITRDVETDPRWRDYRDLARTHGLRACWSVPICASDGRVIATFASYAREPSEPSPAEMRVVDTYTRTAAIAIERDRLDRAIEQLLASERRARSEAEHANRAKDEFLALVSHELRSPLNALVGWARLLQSEALDAETRTQGLDAIARNVEFQRHLIEDLLDLSRLATGRFEIKRVPVDLASVVRAAAEALRPEAESRGLDLEVEVTATRLPGRGDPDRLHQVLHNLLSNAIKFTPRGGRIGLQAAQTGDDAEICVSDTGVGIEPARLARVFDRFYQRDSADTGSGGLGLGLTIVRHLVVQHGGTVTAESPGRGEGTRFIVRLPLDDSVDLEDTTRDEDTDADITGLRVLVVDDQDDARTLLATALRLRGAEVDVARSAVEALQRFRVQPPDVVVSDISMPEMDGFELVRRLRAQATNPVTVIAVSARAREGDRLRAAEAGFDVHLAKPVQLDRLVNEIATRCGREASLVVERAGLRILVVEDHRDSADSLAIFLRRGGHEVAVAYEGESGIEIAEGTRPDVVLCDLRLPDLDGREVARRLRASRGDELRLIALTGESGPEVREEAYASGFDDLFVKPIDLAALRQKLAPDAGGAPRG